MHGLTVKGWKTLARPPNKDPPPTLPERKDPPPPSLFREGVITENITNI